MTQDERRGWLHAAYAALGDVPPWKLEWAVAKATETVDHPSKIVPAIRKAIAPPDFANPVPMSGLTLADLAKPAEDDRERSEVRQLMRGLVEKMTAGGEE